VNLLTSWATIRLSRKLLHKEVSQSLNGRTIFREQKLFFRLWPVMKPAELADGPTLYVRCQGRESVSFGPPISYGYRCTSDSLLSFRLRISPAKNQQMSCPYLHWEFSVCHSWDLEGFEESNAWLLAFGITAPRGMEASQCFGRQYSCHFQAEWILGLLLFPDVYLANQTDRQTDIWQWQSLTMRQSLSKYAA
jgi:hypothetical protein